MADDSSKKDKTRGIAAFRFKPGQSGNPGGSAKGYRKTLSAAFLRSLAADFEQHGAAAIIAARQADPVSYARIVASLLPKEVELTSPFDDVSDEELTALIEHLRANIAAAAMDAEADGSSDGSARH